MAIQRQTRQSNLPIMRTKTKGNKMKTPKGKIVPPQRMQIQREKVFVKCPKCANVQQTTAIYHTSCQNCKYTIRIDKWNTQTIHTGQPQ